MGDNDRPMSPVDELVGRCAQIAALREQLRALLAREANLRRLPPILITGETGTGKGLVADIIHRSSSRSSAPFVAVNGAAIPETLLESELFGYERGAFTDARQSKAGLIQVAHRGTLFLDEVALLPPLLQAKLLKVVEDASVRRLGSTRSEPVDACIISATNENPEALVRARRFREDLYHRLAVITLALPPLRERGDDIELLAEQALARESVNQSGLPKKFGQDARVALRAHPWPGNVRELNSVIARVVLMCPTAIIPAAALELDPLPPVRYEEALGGGDLSIAELERQQLSKALERTGWNISHAAAALGLTRNTVRARIARFGLRPGRRGESPAMRPDRTGETDSPSPTRPDHDVVFAHGARESERASVGPVGAPRGRPSIAVLPFHVEDEDLSKNYFGEGMVEDIVGALASIRELLVISRSSTLRYRGPVDVRVVGTSRWRDVCPFRQRPPLGHEDARVCRTRRDVRWRRHVGQPLRRRNGRPVRPPGSDRDPRRWHPRPTGPRGRAPTGASQTPRQSGGVRLHAAGDGSALPARRRGLR